MVPESAAKFFKAKEHTFRRSSLVAGLADTGSCCAGPIAASMGSCWPPLSSV